MRVLLLLSVFLLAHAAEMVENHRQVWDGSEGWTVFWPDSKGPAPWSVTKVAGRTELRIPAGETELALPFFEGHIKGTVQFDGATRLSQEVELVEGGGVTMALSLVDADKELFAFPARPLTAGLNTLAWSIPSDVTATYAMGGKADKTVDGTLRLWEYKIVRKAGGTAARLRMGPAEVSERKALLDSVHATVTTGHPINLVLLPDAVEHPELLVTSGAAVPVRVRCEAVLTGWDGERLGALAEDLSLAPGETRRLALPDTGRKPGIRWVDLVLADGVLRHAERQSFALLAPVRNPPGHQERGFLFSICTHAERWPTPVREREFLAMSLVGADVVRTSSGWAQIEPAAGTYHWEVMDELVELARKHGLEIQGNLGNCAKWAASEAKAADPNHLTWLFSPPVRGWEAWEKINEVAAKRYAGRVRWWEVGNEVDLAFFWNGNVDDYIRYLRLAYAGIKRGDPQAMVMTCGFSGIGPHDGKKLNPDMQERVIREAQDAFDVHAFHQHGPFGLFQRVVEVEMPKLRSALQAPRPVWYNETAMYSSPNISERSQAETLYKKLLIAWGSGGMGYTWYELRNGGTDPRNPEHNFGMLTESFMPKAVYVAYAAMTRVLGEVACTGRLDLGQGAYGWSFSGEGRHAVAGWLERRELADRLLAVQVGPQAEAVSVDLMGVETPMPVRDGVVLWPVTHSCRILSIRSDKPPRLLPQPIDLPAATTAEPGVPLTITAGLAPPIPAAGAVALEWIIPEGLKTTDATRRQADFSAGRTTLSLMPGRRPAGAPHDQPLPMLLRWSIPGTPWVGELAIPVQLTLVLPRDSLSAAEPVFRLAARDRVVGLFDNDPSGVAHVWQGPRDLSADIWLGVDGGDLVWRVLVQDDHHRQPNRAPDLWKADGIQLGIQVPGQAGPWEFGFARHDDGRPLVHSWMVPKGRTAPGDRIALETALRPDGVEYRMRIPCVAIGLEAAHLRDGFRANLIVNDDDTGVRKGWIQIAPGIGERKDVAPWPVIRCESP